MPANIPWSERRKELAAKYRITVGKENVRSSVQTGKSTEGKVNARRKKGLSASWDNRNNDAKGTFVPKSSIGKAQFLVYRDSNDGNEKSLSRVRQGVSSSASKATKEILRERQKGEANRKAQVSVITKESKRQSTISSADALQRARSLSNSRSKVSLDAKNKLNVKSSQRSCSDNRGGASQRLSCLATASSDTSPKNKCLSSDVKKRTFSSIQTWKDKMRKPEVNGVPLLTLHPNHQNAYKEHTKVNLLKSSAIDHTRTIRSKCSLTARNEPRADTSKNILNTYEPLRVDCPIHAMKAFIKDAFDAYLSNEFETILQNKKFFNEYDDIGPSTSSANGNHQYSNQLRCSNVINSNTLTPLDGPSMLPLTPTKVRHEKRGQTRAASNVKEDPDNIQKSPYECDYLDDLPDVERKREENAPKLSSRFLQENVNADQRRIIVGYLIRLGVHCNFSTHVIYQAVKTFDVAIDRILVATDDIQLIALACLWITLKREATVYKIPSATTVLRLAKDLYTDQENCLIMYEKKILLAFKFNVRFPDPFSLLLCYIWSVVQTVRCNITQSDVKCLYFCGSYLIDITMMDEGLCNTSVCVLTMAALELSFTLIFANIARLEQAWSEFQQSNQLLTEWELRAMTFVKQIMIQLALRSSREFGLNIIYKKYQRSKHGNVSDLLLNNLKDAFLPNDAEEFSASK